MAEGFALISGEFSVGQVGKVEIIICLCSWLIPHIFDMGFPLFALLLSDDTYRVNYLSAW